MSVPWISQMGNAARNDCGPACALMCARALGKGTGETVQSLAERFDPPADGTTAADLRAMWSYLGLLPTIGDGYPHVALVRYTDLSNRYDPNYTGLHWIVRVDDTHYHDPLWPDSRGANILAPKATLDTITRAKLGVSMTTADTSYHAREPYDRVVHVPPQTATREQYDIVCNEAYLHKQTVAFSFDDACLPIDGLKSRTVIVWGVAPSQQQAYRDFVLLYYPAPTIPTTITFRQFVPDPPTPPDPPQPPIVAGHKLGVHCNNNAHILAEMAARGCRAFVVLNNKDVAVQLATNYPDAIVVHRRYLNGWQLDGAQMAAMILEGPNHPRLLLQGYNEQDEWGYGTAGELRTRCQFELQAARIVRAQVGGTLLAGNFSVGTLKVEDDAIMQVLREEFAGPYNDGLIWLGQHAYSPFVGHVPDKWYELRHRWYFEKAGLNPAVRHVIRNEAGSDRGGHGGYPAQGATIEQFRAEQQAVLAAMAQPLRVNGLAYADPCAASMIYQVGNDTDWAGYCIGMTATDRYMPALSEFLK